MTESVGVTDIYTVSEDLILFARRLVSLIGTVIVIFAVAISSKTFCKSLVKILPYKYLPTVPKMSQCLDCLGGKLIVIFVFVVLSIIGATENFIW